MEYMAAHWVMFVVICVAFSLISFIGFIVTAVGMADNSDGKTVFGFLTTTLATILAGLSSIPAGIAIIAALIKYIKHA